MSPLSNYVNLSPKKKFNPIIPLKTQKKEKGISSLVQIFMIFAHIPKPIKIQKSKWGLGGPTNFNKMKSSWVSHINTQKSRIGHKS